MISDLEEKTSSYRLNIPPECIASIGPILLVTRGFCVGFQPASIQNLQHLAVIQQ